MKHALTFALLLGCLAGCGDCDCGELTKQVRDNEWVFAEELDGVKRRLNDLESPPQEHSLLEKPKCKKGHKP